ncbi:S8 family peptidase [Butyrivibrio sp. AE3006]|uniref:S8 family peptidase n=1 Tax=Butyrivibrio sp. AE3006 TaxID=1280673 RepID=UPI00040AE7F4|nr:S8 family peptidase [Butyrivibrio sp. AE3006]
MNSLLGIKMPYNHEPNSKRPGARNIKKANFVYADHILKLIADLNKIKSYYEEVDNYIDGCLIDVYYNDIIAKSGRIQEILKFKSDCNKSIVGARFTESQDDPKHIITHYVSAKEIEEAIHKLQLAYDFIDTELGGCANSENFRADNTAINYPQKPYNKSKIRNTIIDCSVIDGFAIPNVVKGAEIKDRVILTFYNTKNDLDTLFERIGIDSAKYIYSPAGKNSISASVELFNYLVEKVPYLISMVATDISKIDYANDGKYSQNKIPIPKPNNEPVIGVIDTLFDKNVYFGEWVDYRETLELYEQHSTKKEHYEHGTAVSSIIVDGPTLNPWLDDGLGRFRVRHFGVCAGTISPTRLIYKIEKIVNENQDIHVWNLCLGTNEEVSKNFISFDAAALDEIQEKKNVIFVVAGTNDNRSQKKDYLRIGSPADSLNAIVVNSVKRDGTPASYSRSGKILSFFNKPDVSYYGGDYEDNERINVCTNKGIDKQYGTSFAAPWISRKMCYLIEVLGFTRETAKALIIDSAAGWEYKQGNYRYQNVIGYGVVPRDISAITTCEDSEIKFVMQGISDSYVTSNYAIPVPKDENGNNPYVARATLCYFPECNRLEGVDYTQRELSLKFGRVSSDGIVDINKNIQDEEGEYSSERRARNEFRKWDNTKFISSLYREKGMKSLKNYGEGLWGVTLTSKERRRYALKKELRFGMVITVRNIKGVNKINDFKHACLLRGYIVNEINATNQNEIYQKAQEEIVLE